MRYWAAALLCSGCWGFAAVLVCFSVRGWRLAAGCSGLLSRRWSIADLLRWGSSLSAGCRDEMLSAGFFGGGTVGAGLWMLCYKCNFRIRVRKAKNVCGFVM